MKKTVHDPNRKITAKDLPDIFIGLLFGIFLGGFMMLKHIFPGNEFVQKYTTGIMGLLNGFLLIIIIGFLGFFWSKKRQNK